MTLTAIRPNGFGAWGRNDLFDQFNDYQGYVRRCMEAGINPKTRQPLAGSLLESAQAGNWDLLDRQLIEADGRADFNKFLWEPINAGMLDGYDSLAGKFASYTRKRNLRSFDVHRLKGTNGLTGMAHVGEYGEYVHARRSFRPEVGMAAETYGMVYEITRKLARSEGADDILKRIPAEMGETVADYITQLVIALIVSNPTHVDGVAAFHSSRGNISTADVTATEFMNIGRWMGTRKNPDGRPIRVQLKSAVTQNVVQAAKILQFLQSVTLALTGVSTTAQANSDFGRAMMNPIPKLDLMSADGVITDAYMPDAEDVYYFADPAKLAAFHVGYLDGQEKPFIGMTDATVMHMAASSGSGFDAYSYQGDTIGYKARIDFAAQLVEPLGAFLQSPA